MTEEVVEEKTEEQLAAEAAAAEEQVNTEDKALEDRARRMGWRPKDEYGGDKSRWVDARTFIERGETELPILRERFRKLDDRFSRTETELKETKDRLTESTKVLVEIRDMNRTAEERAFARAQAEIAQREREAVREASEEKYEAVRREREALEQTRPKPVEVRTEAPPPKVADNSAASNPEVEQWVSENQWFINDRVLNAYAIDEDSMIKRDHPEWTVQEQLAEVKRRVLDRFPEKFNTRRRPAPPPVAVSTATPPKPKGKTVKDLPPEAKQALERFKKTIPGYTDEEYLKNYFAGEE